MDRIRETDSNKSTNNDSDTHKVDGLPVEVETLRYLAEAEMKQATIYRAYYATLRINIDLKGVRMRTLLSIIVLLGMFFFVTGCVAPRLGKEMIRYDNVSRAPTPKDQFIAIFDSREDVPFAFTVIGEVQAAPMRAERDFGYDPVQLLKDQARDMGGIALLEVRSGEDHNSRHVWK